MVGREQRQDDSALGQLEAEMKLTVTENGALASNELKPKRANRSLRPSAIWLVIPGVAFLAAAFVLPLVILLSQSVYDEGFTLRYFEMIFTTPSYLAVIWITLKTAVLATAATMLLAYPVSCYLMVAKPATRSIMMGVDHYPILDEHPRALLRLDGHPPAARAREHVSHRSSRRDRPAD